MDNHEFHKFLPALELASKNHVVFQSLSLHNTHIILLCVRTSLNVFWASGGYISKMARRTNH